MAERKKALKVMITNVVMQNGGDKAIFDAIRTSLKHYGIMDDFMVAEDINLVTAHKYYPNEPVEAYPYYHGRRFRNRYLNFIWNKLQQAYFMLMVVVATLGFTAQVEKIAAKPLRESIRRIKNADVVVSTGGTYLIEKYGYAQRVMGFLLVVAYKKPMVLMTQSMGPFTAWYGQMLVRYVFPKLTLVLLRDEKSLRHLQQIGVKTDNCKVLPDIVLAAAETGQWTTRKYPSKPKNVAISVRNCALFHEDGTEGQKAYEANVARLVEELTVRHGAKVTFVSTCQGMPEYHFNDSLTAESIHKQLSPKAAASARVESHFMTPAEFQNHMKEFDLLISTRMHGAIQGLNAGTPVLPIAYEFKTVELWRLMGLPEYVVPLDESDAGAWLDKLNRVVENYPDYRKKLGAEMQKLQPAALSAGSYVAKVLKVAA